MNRVSEFQSLCFPPCFLTGVVRMDDSIILEIYSFSYDRVEKKAVFNWFYYLLLNSNSTNICYFMLFWQSMSHCNMLDVRFNPHKPTRGSVQQSLSEI